MSLSHHERLLTLVGELVDSGITLAQAMEQFEAKFIEVAMDRAQGNITNTSRKLGIHRNTLHNKLRDTHPALKSRARGMRRRRPADRRRNRVAAYIVAIDGGTL